MSVPQHQLTRPPPDSSSTTSDSPSFSGRMRRKITREIRRRLRAGKKLKKARNLLRRTLVKEKVKEKRLRTKILSKIGNTSNSRVIWHELDFSQWLRRETSMHPRRLTPSAVCVVSIHSKSAEEWDPWSHSHYSYSLKHRALVNKTDKFYKEMWHFTVPQQVTAPGDFSDMEFTTAAETKRLRSENELRRFNRTAARVIKKYLVSKGRPDEANTIKIQHVILEPRDFAIRVNVVAGECCTEMTELSRRLRSNATEIKKCLKKRSQEFKNWNVSRAYLGRGNFGGLAAGRPSPLRTSISVEDLEDQQLDAKKDTKPMETDWDWGTESKNINYSSVEW